MSNRYNHLPKLLFSVCAGLLMICNSSLQAQEGFQVMAGGAAGISYIAPQNHYDNDFYELDYKTTLGYNGGLAFGYGFSDLISVIAEGSYAQFHQKYAGSFSPGYGAGKLEHSKDLKLSYYNLGFYAKFATSFKDDYVYDTKLQGYAMAGFQMSKLGNAKQEYILNGAKIEYPTKIIPYPAEGYPYAPVSDPKVLFTPWAVSFVANIGVDWFVTEKLAISPAIRGQISLSDINSKNYRVHDPYKASRTIFAGLYLGITYYINRGE